MIGRNYGIIDATKENVPCALHRACPIATAHAGSDLTCGTHPESGMLVMPITETNDNPTPPTLAQLAALPVGAAVLWHGVSHAFAYVIGGCVYLQGWQLSAYGYGGTFEWYTFMVQPQDVQIVPSSWGCDLCFPMYRIRGIPQDKYDIRTEKCAQCGKMGTCRYLSNQCFPQDNGTPAMENIIHGTGI